MKQYLKNKPQLLKLSLAVALALGTVAGVIDPVSASMAGGALLSTSALSSQSTTIAVGDVGSPDNFQTIPEVSSINGPSGSASIIDVTDLSSTAKEKTMGLMDEGQISLDINYIPTNAVHEILRAARAAKTLKSFRITFTDGTKFTCSGYVTGFPVTNAVDQVMKVSVTIEITGAVTKS